ncbi:hypothetical protein Trydic_g10769 [Trypoxylus dichotomus]
MKSTLIFVAVVACAYALPVSEEEAVLPDPNIPRTVFPEEDNPWRQRYIVMEDSEGHYHIEDLWRNPGETRANINDLTLFLFTRNNPTSANTIPANNFNAILSSQFSPARISIFVAHGWNSNVNSGLNAAIRNAVLNRFDANVFIVDWSGPANQFYTTAMSAVPIIGGLLGNFINQIMISFNLTPASFRLVGHSLGAHLVGVAGKQINGLADSIVGLDPAGPLYSVGNTANRIAVGDGDFVQIIHTNGGLLGFGTAIGDADFYPNGGSSQPGCGLDLIGTCAHSRAHEFFAESVATSNFWARNCGTQQAYTSGACNGNHRAFMGEFVVDKRIRGRILQDYNFIYKKRQDATKALVTTLFAVNWRMNRIMLFATPSCYSSIV